ncbi:MAG: response regulator [Proteobacteria bacterium]|nr:response regulator [Pseudomonadota bacterium]
MSVTSKSKNRSPDLPEPDGMTDAGSMPVTERIMDFRPRDRALSFVNMSLAAERADPFRVLIVDDDAAHRNLVSEILSAPLFSVSTAMSGRDALELLTQKEFDVVLVDKVMPEMSGDELCQAIRERYNRHILPVIVVTGSHGYADLSISLAGGANDFIRKPYDPNELIARVRSAATTKRLTDQMESAETLLFGLARMVEAKDECTGDHCSRLAHYAEVFGAALGLGERDLAALKSGAILHDIGKLAIPDRVLLKPGALSEQEWVLMKQHTVIGAMLCGELKSLRSAVPIIRHHHERWDGSGYPDGLAGSEIPLLAQIFQLLDVFDALTTARPYKEAWSVERARDIIEEEMNKGYYNPALTREFLALLRADADGMMRFDARSAVADGGRRIYEALLANGCVPHG